MAAHKVVDVGGSHDCVLEEALRCAETPRLGMIYFIDGERLCTRGFIMTQIEACVRVCPVTRGIVELLFGAHHYSRLCTHERTQVCVCALNYYDNAVERACIEPAQRLWLRCDINCNNIDIASEHDQFV